MYLYPHEAYPYAELIRENKASRSKLDPEYEIEDTGIFSDDKFFEVFVEYAKPAENDILTRYVGISDRSIGDVHHSRTIIDLEILAIIE